MNSKLPFKSLFITGILIFAGSLSVCKAQTIHGAVTDAKTGKPLAGANILQLQTQNGSATDKNGHFSLTLIQNKSSKIRVSFIGYNTEIINTIHANGPLKIALTPEVFQSNAIFVQAVRAGKSAPVASQTLKRAQIKKNNMGQSLPYLLRNMASVTTTSDAGAGIGYIRILGRRCG
jgi:iron complex outermembrane receptor protein